MDKLKDVLYEYKEYHGDQYFDKNLGKLLSLVRLKKGIRQRNLASRADIPNNSLSDIERGLKIPTIGTLNKVANALGRHLIVSITDD